MQRNGSICRALECHGGLVAYCRAVDAGTIDPREPVVVPVRRTPGITGISALADPVTMSWRDLVTSMVTASDNAAADVVHTRVGRDRLGEFLGHRTVLAPEAAAATARALIAQTAHPDLLGCLLGVRPALPRRPDPATLEDDVDLDRIRAVAASLLPQGS